MMKNNDVTQKYLSKEKIIELLESLPENSILSPNKVGNLAIFDNEKDCNFIGFIDFLHDGEICK